MKLVHGRLAGVSVRASFGAGLWVGFTIGLVIGDVPHIGESEDHLP